MKVLEEDQQGFRSSPVAQCIYFNEATKVRVVVHVDDCFAQDLIKDKQCCVHAPDRGMLSNSKSSELGHGKKGHFFGRTIRWTYHGLTYTGHGKLLEGMLDEWSV